MKFTYVFGLLLAFGVLFGATAKAEEYAIDKEGAHAFITFKISHLGFSFIHGRFDNFDGQFSFDEFEPEKAKIEVEIDTASVNTNHDRRDKHIRNEDFLDVSKFPKAKFVSTGVKVTGDKTADVTGNLTLMGVTKPIILKARYLGGGADPWGGTRAGFEATTAINMSDWPFKKQYGEIEFDLTVEGIQKK